MALRSQSRLGPALLLTLIAVALVALVASGGRSVRLSSETALDEKRQCVYSQHKVSQLAAFGRLVGSDVTCAVVFNDANPDWRAWERPWFLTNRNSNMNWRRWKTASDDRTLVITQNLFPDSEKSRNWLKLGSSGAYDSHDRALARNLVRAGLGNSVIRLGHEANGTTYSDSVGNTPLEQRQWAIFWRRTAKAMRSVDGAHFIFDWCINSGWRQIPLKNFYPGDDVVDIVGIDAYDAGVKQATGRWSTIYNRPSGIRDVVRFARAHGKPLSIPEWGVADSKQSLAGGDDPAYVRGIARVVKSNPTVYQGYFFANEWGSGLRSSPQSLNVYRKSFGGSR
jgi:hypothetical protein